jgi:hypothetical protein
LASRGRAPAKVEPPAAAGSGSGASGSGGGGGGGGGGGPLAALLRPLAGLFQRAAGDPFYGVVAYRNFKREEEA